MAKTKIGLSVRLIVNQGLLFWLFFSPHVKQCTTMFNHLIFRDDKYNYIMISSFA